MTKKIISLFLGAGASVPYQKPTTEKLKNKLKEKYTYSEDNNITPAQYYLYSILSFPIFQDIEHVLQCIKEIDSFFSIGNYGGAYFLEQQYRLNDSRRPWLIQDLRNQINNIKKIIEDEVFENYAWNYSSDDELVKILNTLSNVIKK